MAGSTFPIEARRAADGCILVRVGTQNMVLRPNVIDKVIAVISQASFDGKQNERPYKQDLEEAS